MPQPDEFYTADELAARFRLARSTLFSWRKAGKGPRSIRVGGRVLYRASDVEEWLADQEATWARGGVA